MGDMKVNYEQMEILKKTVISLTEHTLKQLDKFMQIESDLDDEVRPGIFMVNVTHTYLCNLFVKASNGDAEIFKNMADIFIKGFEDFIKFSLPVIESNLKMIKEKNKGTH